MKIKTQYYLICILFIPLLFSCTTVQKEKRKEVWVRSHLPTMVTVEGGTFLFEGGANGAEEVYVPTFQIADTEMTQYLFCKIENLECDIGYRKYPAASYLQEITNFCNKLSEICGYTPCYSGDKKHIVCDFTANGFRLPTNEEWEFAAKGGNKSKGYIYSGSNDIDEVAWYGENDIYNEHNVAQKKPNELGLYDMSGNVSELCWIPEAENGTHFTRGGDHVHPKEFSSVSHPGCYVADDDEWLIPYGEASCFILGFRICRTVTATEENE